MKNLIYTLLISFIVASCVTYKSLDFNKITIGMSETQVRAILGPPERILAANNSRAGYQLVLQYRTAYNEVYALEFWDDYLTGYEFLYEDIIYVPAPAPIVRPPAGQPVFPDYRPPSNSNRPNRPNNNNSSTRPPGSSTNRPNTSEQPENTRPENSSGTEGSTRPTTRPVQTNTENSREKTNQEEVR